MPEVREENRKEALSRAVQQIEKSFGKGAIMYLREDQSAMVARPKDSVRTRCTTQWARRRDTSGTMRPT